MNQTLRDQPALPVCTSGEASMSFKSVVSDETDTRRTWVCLPPDTVIPIVFVPGIMGSNLQAKVDILDRKRDIKAAKGKAVWRVDGESSMLGWPVTGPESRQLLLNKDMLEVDPLGLIPSREGEPKQVFGVKVPFSQRKLGITPRAGLPVAVARERGWGTVAAMFYGEFLDWLEQQLNDAEITPFGTTTATLAEHLQRLTGTTPPGAQGQPAALTDQDIKHLCNFDFPVHAFGYNWLQSNVVSGQQLGSKIKEIIAHYQKQGRSCDKVILLTHSMGGLVARAACKVHGAEAQVWGVVHGVMPTDGAAATYKRFVAGFGGEGGGPKGYTVGHVLGASGQDTTPVLAFAPGPMELLPNARYNGGKPWFWVKDAHGHEVLSLPQKGDPYTEIYARQDAWWRMVNPDWLNPAGMPDIGFTQFRYALRDAAKFHSEAEGAGGKFHQQTFAHYGMDTRLSAWGTVGWQITPLAGNARGLHSTGWENSGSGEMVKWEQTPTIPFASPGSLYMGGMPIKLPMARISNQDAPGDGTVPGLASGAGVDASATVVCRHTGYPHDKSYQDPQVRRSVLDAMLRIIAAIPEPV